MSVPELRVIDEFYWSVLIKMTKIQIQYKSVRTLVFSRCETVIKQFGKIGVIAKLGHARTPNKNVYYYKGYKHAR